MIELTGVTKIYPTRSGDVAAISSLDWQVSAGEFVTVRGPSGSGKTTLLVTLGGMLRPTRGTVRVAGTDLYETTPAGRADFRSRNVGFVFQLFHLVPYLTVLENVRLGALHTAVTESDVRQLLDRLGLADRSAHRANQLSAGEQQRTALARALIKLPQLILADEPAGNLDPDNAAEVFQILREYCDSGGTVVLVTHGELADNYSDRVVHLSEGRFANEVAKTT